MYKKCIYIELQCISTKVISILINDITVIRCKCFGYQEIISYYNSPNNHKIILLMLMKINYVHNTQNIDFISLHFSPV